MGVSQHFTSTVEKDKPRKTSRYFANPKEKEIVEYVTWRMDDMKDARKEWEIKWEQWDLAVKAGIPFSTDGKAQVNLAIEQWLIDLYVGNVQKFQFKVEPEVRCDYRSVMIAKYTMDHFIRKEWVHIQLNDFYYNKAKYWTGILWSGVWFESRFVSDNDDYFSKNEKQQKRDIWHIGIKDWSIWDVYFDERAVQTWEDGMDCIAVENIGEEEFRLRYEWKKQFSNVEYVQWWTHYEIKGKSAVKSDRNVLLWHYFNKVTWRYTIIANKEVPIYIGTRKEQHGELPFVPVQHYKNTDSIYGIGIPERLKVFKPYMNNIFKVLIDWAWLSAWVALVTGNNTEVDGEAFIAPWEANIWRFTGDVNKDMTQLSFQQNMQPLIELLKLMDDYNIQATGLNIKAPYSTPAWTAFEAWLMKEEQNTRLKVTAELMDLWLEKALNMMLSNIIQFAPSLYATYLFAEGNNSMPKDFKPYQIKIENMKSVDRFEKDEDWNDVEVTDFEEAPGQYSFIDLKKWLLKNGMMKLSITTPSTSSTLKTIEKQEFTTQLDQAMLIKQVFPDANIWNAEQWMERWETVYDIDVDNQFVKSKEDKIRKEQAEIMDLINTIDLTPEEEWGALPLTTPGNENTLQQALLWASSQGTGSPQPQQQMQGPPQQAPSPGTNSQSI